MFWEGNICAALIIRSTPLSFCKKKRALRRELLALLPEGAREGDGVTMRLALEPANDYKDDIDRLLDSLGDSL